MIKTDEYRQVVTIICSWHLLTGARHLHTRFPPLLPFPRKSLPSMLASALGSSLALRKSLHACFYQGPCWFR